MNIFYALMLHMVFAFTLRHDGKGIPERLSALLLFLVFSFIAINYQFLKMSTPAEETSPYIGVGGALLAIVLLVAVRPRLSALILITKLSGILLAIVGLLLFDIRGSLPFSLSTIVIWSDIAAVVAVVKFGRSAKLERERSLKK